MRLPFLCLALLVLITPPLRADDSKVQKDRFVQPTHWGRVNGQIYDAVTGAPLAGAEVAVRSEGAFATSGRTVGTTDAAGRYRAEALLGRLSSNLDIGRALNSGLIGLLIGGANNETRRIDVTRLALRVTHDGYNPFEGVVLCRKLDPGRFSVDMEAVLLTPMSTAEGSTATEGWGVVRLLSLTVEPAVLKPGGEGVLTARVQSPTLPKPGDLRIRCVSKEIVKKKDLKLARTEPDGTLIYTEKFTAPKGGKVKTDTIEAYVDASPYDLAWPGRVLTEIRKRRETPDALDEYYANRDALRAASLQQSAVLQIAATPAEETAAASRSEAYRLMQQGENVKAAAKLKELCAVDKPDLWDLNRLADVSEQLHDNATMVEALRRIRDLTPEKQRMPLAGRYADALVSAGDGAAAISEYMPMVRKIKDPERVSQELPVPLLVALGNACIQTKDLEQARKIDESLLKSEIAPYYPPTAEFRDQLRLAVAKSKLDEKPGDAQAEADYGRVLMDLGRWEEASTLLRQSLKTNPEQPAVERDLQYAVVHLNGGAPEAKQDLDEAVANAQRNVEFADGKKKVKSKDFSAWHTLAMLLYAKSAGQHGDPAAGETLARCQEAIREGLRCARQGASMNDGIFLPYVGYAQPSVVAISGFAYPEANSDFLILESLQNLKRDPKDYLALYDLATALVAVGRPELAKEPVDRVLALKPDLTDALYLRARIEQHAGEHEAAVATLKGLLKANPRHPHANLMLAHLYEEDGDTASAAACLAAHSRLYGPPR